MALRCLRLLTNLSGSAVAVERVFSGGRDTISMRRARLSPETICTLMLVKHHLRQKCKDFEKVVGTMLDDVENVDVTSR